MSSSGKDIKSFLKEAREAIKKHDFSTAAKLCKAVLKEEKDNYMAWVFLGVSLQEVGPAEQAPNAFRKAIQINPTNILAWNGLLNYLEKADSKTNKELIGVYCKLSEIESNENKIVDYSEKLEKLCTYENLSEIWQALYKLGQNENFSQETLSSVRTSLVSILVQFHQEDPELLSVLKEMLVILIKNPKTVSQLFYSEYLKLLHKENDKEVLISAAEDMHKLYEGGVIPLEWICKVYNDLYMGDELPLPLEDKIKIYCEELLGSEPKSRIGLFTKSILLCQEGKFAEACPLLKQVTSEKPGLLNVWILLTQCYLQLKFHENAIESVVIAKNLAKSDKHGEQVKRKVNLLYADALSYSCDQNKLSETIELCEEILQEIPSESEIKVLCPLIRALIVSEDFSKASFYLTKLKQSYGTTTIYNLLVAKLLHKQKKLQEALNLLNSEEGATSEWFMELGDLYWDLGNYEKSLVPFLKAAKCDPENYICYMQLGRYYRKVNDLEKSRRCFEKALILNTKHGEIIFELSEIYRKQKNYDANIALLHNFVIDGINPDNAWAYLQLGLNYLDQENYPSAIESLRLVIRLNPENAHCWESLADAYLARGAYNSALKSYQKAAEILHESVYSHLQIATVKKILGLTAEARADFENIILRNSSYIPALKGLSETCLHQAKEYQRDHMIGLARDCAQVALDNATEGIKIRSDISCLWKLVADSVFFIAQLPEKYSCALALGALVEGEHLEGNKALEKEELFNLATRCYCKAMNLSENDPLIWHDLATCYYVHACNIIKSEKSQQMFEWALSAARHCTVTNPKYWQHWNLIGNIYCQRETRNYALAQHAFVKAVTLECNCAVAWCNLGTLYLVLNEIKLANKAFSEAQRSDPNYLNSWIGQALIAEIAEHEDAMDLFRHSTQLGSHQEGGIGYGHWVCKTLMNTPTHVKVYSIHNMHAVPVACDALTYYTENNPDDPCAWNMLGILRERMGLKSSSANAFRNAYLLSDAENKDAASVNYARTLVKLGDYEKAIRIYSDIKAATFKSGSGLALALFKAQQYEEAYEAYEAALHWLTEEQNVQSDVLVALASIAYMFQGADVAKTLLFQSIQLKPPSHWGLFATLSLALLHNDLKLAKLVLNELDDFKDDHQCLQHYIFLFSYVFLLQDGPITALKEISKLVHRHPDEVSGWLTLFLLQLYGQESKKPSSAIIKCAKIAMKLGKMTMDISKILCLTSLASHRMGNNQGALKSAQKAVHCNPNIPDSWTVLLLSLVSQDLKNMDKINGIIDFVKKHFNPQKTLVEWLDLIEIR